MDLAASGSEDFGDSHGNCHWRLSGLRLCASVLTAVSGGTGAYQHQEMSSGIPRHSQL